MLSGMLCLPDSRLIDIVPQWEQKQNAKAQ